MHDPISELLLDDRELEGLFRLGAQLQHQAVAVRAYEAFVARGSAHGNDLADWFEAKQELLGPR